MTQRTDVSVVLEHVRCFANKQEIPIRPLTLLVGENSSGKTTFLATISCVFDTSRFPLKPALNESPYQLGSFDTIATKAKRHREDSTFTIGFETRERGAGTLHGLIATYGGEYGNVVLRTVKFAGGPTVSFDLTFAETHVSAEFRMADPQTGREAVLSSAIDDVSSSTLDFALLVQQLATTALLKSMERDLSKSLDSPEWKWFLGWIAEAARVAYAHSPFKSCFSFSPIRSKPRRTYDEFSEDYSPEGDHIPTVLARLLGEEPNTQDATQVRDALAKFGQESGLFKGVRVKRLGKDPADPFQLQVGVAGPYMNVADVGYGVSQALPLVVQSVLRTKSDVLLMQQPEVHLHPQAQAALGTFFAELAAGGDRNFLIETHSDHLVDRVRQEVARGTIAPEDVLILFFDKPKLETTIWPLTVDSNGNVQGAPASYRRFFLEEETRLLRRTAV